MIGMSNLDEYSGRKGVLIHHWDTDGIISAAIILKHTDANITRVLPELGRFELPEYVFEEIRGHKPDFIIVADMSLYDEMEELKMITEDIFILDHHATKGHCPVRSYNPVVEGGEPDSYPSAGWVINEYMEEEQNILSVLGAIGEKGRKMKGNTIVEKVLEEKLRAAIEAKLGKGDEISSAPEAWLQTLVIPKKTSLFVEERRELQGIACLVNEDPELKSLFLLLPLHQVRNLFRVSQLATS